MTYDDLAGDRVNRSRMTWPDGYYVSYGYDAMSRMTTQTDSDGVALATRIYENVGRPAVIQYPFANDNVSYSWSPQDELILLTHNLALAANDVTFTDSFTPAHQIKGAAISNAAFKYSPPSGGTDVYPAVNGLNQYVSVTPSGSSAQTISYDTRGNLTCAGTGCPTSTPSANAWVYTYDPENRMMTAGNGTVAAAFAYDPLGRRTQKSGTGVTTTTFLHDGDNEIAEYDGSGNLLRRFVPGAAIDQPVAMVTCTGTPGNGCTGANATKTMFHADKLGSIVAMSNASDGHLAAGPFVYDSYGNCLAGGSACSTAGTPYLYTGQRLDPETGLYYYRARYYSASLGRFMQTDPVGYGAGLNWYAYVGDDPTDQADPSGMVASGCSTPAHGNKPNSTGTCGPAHKRPDGGCGSRIKGGGDSNCRANSGAYEARGPVPGVEPPPVTSGPPPTPEAIPDLVVAAVKYGPLVGVLALASVGLCGDTKAACSQNDEDGQQPYLLHYTNDKGRAGILESGKIDTSKDGNVYVTVNVIPSGAMAKSLLALSSTPTGFFRIPIKNFYALHGPGVVAPANGELGGGFEIKNLGPVPVAGATWVSLP